MSASSSVSVSDCSGGGGEPATVDDVSLCAVTKPRRHAGDDVGASSPSAAVEANTTFTLLPELGDAPADGLRLSGRACADTVNTQTARVSTDNWGKCASGAADNVDFDGDIITLINNINNNNDGVTFSGVTVDCRSGGVFDANVNVVRPTPGVDVFKVPLAAGATDKPRCTIANVLPMVAGVVGNSKFHQTMAQSRGEQFIHSSQGFSCVLDELENRSEGGLAPELARNSLYVNFDPILSRPSVAPIVKHLRSARDDTLPASAVPTAIKEDLIAFSPGSSPAAAPPPVCTKQLVDTVGDGLTHDGPSPACLIGQSSDRPQQQPSQGQECGVGCVGEGLVRGLSTCAGGDEEDVCYPMACAQKQHPRQQQPLFADVEKTQQQQQQQEYFQQELQKRDREVVTLQQTVGKLKQQLEAARVAEQKGLSLVDASCRALHLALAELEAARDHCHQQTRQLAEQRDEARAEVVSIEAMFADLHRKYEKSKLMLNEQTCVSEAQSERLKEVLHQVSRETQRHDLLKQYAENAIQKARTDMELARQTHETEALRLSARLQLADNKEVKLAHENHELTALCDELIQKMGASR